MTTETQLRKTITGLFGHIEMSNQLKEFGTIKTTEIVIREHAIDIHINIETKVLLTMYLTDMTKLVKFVYELFETRANLKNQFNTKEVLVIPESNKEVKFIFYFRR